MKLQRRSAFGWPGTAAGYAPCKNGLVVHYDGANKGLARKPHSACVDYWKWCRRFHMGTRGWADVGYSYAVCAHGYVMEGRGWQRQQAAQPGGNSTWTSVTFMSGPAERPTTAQIGAFRDLRNWLRGKGLAAAVSYHGRFISTTCPGAILRGLVTSGALIAGDIKEDKDMPEYVSVGVDSPQELPPNEWVTVTWGHEYSDGEHHHWDKGGSSFVIGPARYSVTANVRISGLPVGTEIQARAIERHEDTGDVDGGPLAEYTASGGDTFVHYALPADVVSDKRRVRFQVIHYGTATGRITGGSAKAFVWEQ